MKTAFKLKCAVCGDEGIMRWDFPGDEAACERTQCIQTVIDLRTLTGKPDLAKYAWEAQASYVACMQ